MSTDSETKFLNRKGSWKFIPDRYQAMVATIVSAFLYFEAWVILFKPSDAGSYNCGSLFRPILDQESPEDPVGWFWNIFNDVEKARCPRQMTGLYWEFLMVAVGLAICGLVMRRAMKRESATKAN